MEKELNRSSYENMLKKEEAKEEKKKAKTINVVYAEPADYFPKSTRQKYRLGEYCKELTNEKINYLIKSVILGHAVADALGVPVEFCTREELDSNPVTDMRGFGTYPYPAGTWSDDTTMTLCALEAMCHDDWNLSMIMDNFVKWIDNGEFTPTGECFDVGITSSKAIRAYSRGASVDECGLSGEFDNGNGSLMRINPFVLYAYIVNVDYDFFREIIRNGSALTHAHERSILGCQIYGYVLAFLLTEQSKESIKMGSGFMPFPFLLYLFFVRLSGIDRRDKHAADGTAVVQDCLCGIDRQHICLLCNLDPVFGFVAFFQSDLQLGDKIGAAVRIFCLSYICANTCSATFKLI